MLSFRRPKTPGYGISAEFYLSILSPSPTLPPITRVIEPHGADGAVEGFGAPLAPGATKESLAAPLSRGAYALASRDRKTVLRMLVLSKEEAGYDPDAFALSSLAAEASPELLARLRATWTVAQLSFESHDPGVFPALMFLQALAVRFATLVGGVVADPLGERYLLPEDVVHPPSPGGELPIAVTDFIDVDLVRDARGASLFTRGLRKFSLPELEIVAVGPAAEAESARFLFGLSRQILLGALLKPGDEVGAPDAPFQVAEGGLDRARWEGIAAYELLPPTSMLADEAVGAWTRAGR